MTGRTLKKPVGLRQAAAVLSLCALGACDENGEFALPSFGGETAAAERSDGTPVRTRTTEEDVERPDVFEAKDRGLWDGRPSLGGVWVAHPDVKEPERALIRNTATGETVIGALFRRERENPGPPLQISSDVAEELGILAGAPTEIYVVALRRQEVEVVEEAAENPVIADLDNPVNVETTPLEASGEAGAETVAAAAQTVTEATEAAAAAATAATGGASTAAASVAPAAAATAAAATLPEAATEEGPVEVNLPPAAPLIVDLPADESGPLLQIGIFSVESNANDAANRLRGLNVPTSVKATEAGGRVVWQVISSPAEGSDAKATLETIKGAGFVDAYPLPTDS